MAMAIQYFFLYFTHKPYSLTTLTSNYYTPQHTHQPSLTPVWPTYISIFTGSSILATVTNAKDGTTSCLMVEKLDDFLPALEISD